MSTVFRRSLHNLFGSVWGELRCTVYLLRLKGLYSHYLPVFISYKLLRYGHFSGINRKIQFKYLGKHREQDGTESETSSNEEKLRHGQNVDSKKAFAKLKRAKEPMEIKDYGSKTGDGPETLALDSGQDSGQDSLLLILKWGGELTVMGREQAEQLGKAYRSVAV